MIRKITSDCRDSLIIALESQLDTRDKRYMFIKMEFKLLTAMIDMEGSAHQAAWNIYCEFEKQSMLGSLISTLNAKLDTNINFELEESIDDFPF